MKFKTITITNLFSYYNDVSFDVSVPETSGRNIIVLMGRNGGGKTSFINSIKLLFLGPSEEIRRTVQRTRTPTEKQYVCGIENEWAGILNLKAKQEKTYECKVKIVWDSSDGKVIAERSWVIDFSRNTYSSKIQVEAGFKGVLTGDDAEDYLEHCLPRSYIPYFFFDGEEVQALAEANSKEIISTMERLLNIRPLENVQEQLQVLRKDWESAAMDATVKRKMAELESEENVLNAKLQELDQKISSKNDALNEVQHKLEGTVRDLQLLWAIPNKASEARLEERQKQKEEQRDDILRVLADGWVRDSFLKTVPGLIDETLEILDGIVNDSSGVQVTLIDSLKSRLPNIFTSPPYPSPRLEPNQAKFYEKRLLKELEVFLINGDQESLIDIDNYRAKKIHNILSAYQAIHNSSHQELENLSEAQQLRKDIFDIEKKRRETGDLSKKQQEEFVKLQEEERLFKSEIDKLKEEIKELQSDRRKNSERVTTIQKDADKLTKQLEIAQENRKQYDFTKNLIDVLEKVKQRLKIQKRQELEKEYNMHLSRLLDSNKLIRRVEIDEQFKISYKDGNGQSVGMSSISAGMKQLSATALLWALKDVSGRDLPIIIDTPMGRIDRKHQENLLLEYYPNVGSQVILLPTDSELDETKHKLLKPHICREYLLNNPEGKSTEVIQRHA